jgi:hypothetical protein
VRALGLLLATISLVVPGSAGASAEGQTVLARLDVPRDLRVVSYYPADAGWTAMWENWRPERIAADLRRLRGLNANTVRVVVPAHFFGYPEPESTKLTRLRDLVGIAARSGLHVHFTLFDWWNEYRDVAGSKRWARAVLAPYVGDPRVAFVELKNELDPADAGALAWTRELVPWLRAFLRGRTPVTVSVGGRRPERDLRALVSGLPTGARPDFFDAHYFTGGGERAQQVFATLRDLAAPTPLWIGELGYPSVTTRSGYWGVPLTQSSQEAAQAHYLKLCFEALAHLGLPAPGIWILDDFAPGAIPPSDVDGREHEYRFGLFRADRSAKPAAAVVRRLFAGAVERGFNGGFEVAALAEDGTSVPALWGSAGELRLTHDTTAARSGRASARVTGPTGRSGRFHVTPVTAPVRDGRAELSAWVRGADASLRVAIAWFDAAGRPVGSKWTSVPAGGDWRRALVVGRPPRAAAYAQIVVEARRLTGSAWLDDVSFSWR